MGPPHRVMQRGSRDAMPRARCHLEVSVFDIFILLFESETPKTEDDEKTDDEDQQSANRITTTMAMIR